MLVSADWLADACQSDNMIILDCTVIVYDREDGLKDSRTGLEEYLTGHVPGARFADLLNDFSVKRKNARFGIPSAKEFAETAASLGISNETNLVIYSASSPLWATRLWWLFRYFGHKNVCVLDGGFQAWIAAGYLLESGQQSYSKSEFRVRVHTDRLALKTDVQATISSLTPKVKLVDALSPEYYAGKAGNIYGYARLGHIKGAINFPSESVLAEDLQSFRSTSEISALAKQQLGAKDTPVITYCGGGIAATQLAFALEHAGYSNMKVYSGSLQEWSADPYLPIETGTK